MWSYDPILDDDAPTKRCDYDGRLTSLTRGAQWEVYLYNGAGARTRTTNQNLAQNHFFREGAGVLSPITRDSNRTYTPGLSTRTQGASTFQHSGLKNVDAQSGATGSMTGAREYDAFGNVILQQGTHAGPFGYAGGFGYHEDAFSGLKQVGHRYYDPEVGRFLTHDPVMDGRNWWTYCGNRPVDATDPDGLSIVILGDDHDILLSRPGFHLSRPVGESYLYHPSKAKVMAMLVAAEDGESFFFWGHGGGKGSLWVNPKETLWPADIEQVAKKRRKLKKGKLGAALLHACNTTSTNRAINGWLSTFATLGGYSGSTFGTWFPNTMDNYDHTVPNMAPWPPKIKL